MHSNELSPIGEHAHRGLRWQLLALVLSLATLFFAIASTSTRYSAALVLLCGISLITAGRSLCALDKLLQIVQPPSPRWMPWLVMLTFVGGPLVMAFGAWRLLSFGRPAP
jgi:hypothetical protein